jgi:glycosyltransferase involved in cell wall biosynthesis
VANPVVSFIISVYNDEQYLPDCITGINGQTYPDYEVIVVDDGSDDGTEHVLHQWKKENDRVHIIRRENQGITSALNLAISHARGHYLARHDGDDISSPYRIAEQVRFMNAHPGTVLAGTHCVEFADQDSPIALYCPPGDEQFTVNTLLKGENPFVHGSIVMRRAAFDKLHDGYRFTYCQDYDLYLRMSSLGEMHIIPEVLYALRNHPTRTFIQKRSIKKHIFKLIMQVNGVLPPDSGSIAESAAPSEGKTSWQTLEKNIIQSTEAVNEKRIEAQYLMSLTGDNLERGNRLNALSCALKSVSACPTWWKTWLSVPYAAMGAVIPHSMIGQWRGRSSVSRYRKTCKGKSLSEIISRSGQGLS